MSKRNSNALIMSIDRANKLHTLESIIGVTFSSLDLLNQVFIHPSYTGENGLLHSSSNQRLEFLGDSVIYIITATLLYKEFPYEDEGSLTERRIRLIREETLAKMATYYHLDDYMIMSHGGFMNKVASGRSTLSDTFEALLGAIYLDKGLEVATLFVKRTFDNCDIEF